jgi:hypothetical protein
MFLLQGKKNYILSFLAVCVLTTVASSPAYAEWKNLGSMSYTRLCPQHIGGDREYKGHGPEVDASIELYTSPDNRELMLEVYMHQIETKSNWSEAEYNRDFRLYRAPNGRAIGAVWSNGEYYYPDIQGGPVEDIYYVDNDHAIDWFYFDSFVNRVAIIGDTKGNDIGNCTEDDAYISVYLNSIWVWYE